MYCFRLFTLEETWWHGSKRGSASITCSENIHILHSFHSEKHSCQTRAVFNIFLFLDTKLPSHRHWLCSFWLFKTATEIIQSHYCITFVKENLLLHLRTNYWETAWKMASFHLITNMWWQHQTPQSGLNVPSKQLAGCFCRFCPLWVIPGRSVLICRGMEWHCWRREVSK